MKKRITNNIFTSLDLELNQNPITGPKIIQIGAVIGNIETGEILEKFSRFVNPNQELESFIIQLTKIRQADVDYGVTLLEAYRDLQFLHEKHQSFCNPITWGGGDSLELLNQLKGENSGFSVWCFGRRWIDCKTLYVSKRVADGNSPSGGLSRAMAHQKVIFKGCAHRADDDALNTFNMYRHMIQYFKEKTPYYGSI